MRFWQAAFALLAAVLIWALFAYNHDKAVYEEYPVNTPLEDTAHYLTKDGEVVHHADN